MRILPWTILIFGCTWIMVDGRDTLQTLLQWPLLDYELPYDRRFLDQYQPENIVPTGIAVFWDKIFIAAPRLRQGVPATLSYIPRNVPLGSGPRLQAYPSWDLHSAGRGEINCTGLISVYRIKIDRCNRLWVLDSGIMTSIDDFTVACPPKILVIDLHTDHIIRRYTFPRESLRPNSLLTNVVIDDTTATTCDDVFLYISDTAGFGIVVFNGATDRSWRVTHATMFPDPNQSTYRILDETFELMDGVVGLGFSPRLNTLYYQPLATDRLFSVPTSVLRAGPTPFGEQLPVTLVGKKSSQGLALGVDPRDDTIYFSPLTETAIAAWQPHTGHQRIVAYSPEKLQFTAEVRWVERDNGNLWLLSSRFHKFFKKQVNTHDINIRILRIVSNEADSFKLDHQYNPHFPLNLYNNTLGF